jgi:hypothetical protein
MWPPARYWPDALTGRMHFTNRPPMPDAEVPLQPMPKFSRPPVVRVVRGAQADGNDSAAVSDRTTTWVLQAPNTVDPLVIRARRPAPAWLAPVVERCQELLRLRAGWNSYGAAPVDIGVVEAALRTLDRIMTASAPLPPLVPTSSGGVQVEWHTQGADFEVAFHPSGTISAAYEDINGDEWEIEEIGEGLDRLAGALESLSRRS